jgi:predicted AAA+ superfamily ATPase
MEERQLRFILTGSSARKLRRSGTNLLGGRAIQKPMYPFTPQELGSEFDLETVLSVGSLPLVWRSPDRRATLQAYVQMYLKVEIQAEAIVRNLPGFARFLPIAALFHGQTLNVSSLARDAGVARMTVADYIEILEDTLLAFRLSAFEGKLRVRERKHPKLYWVDPGIVRAAKSRLDPVHSEEAGSLFEGWIATLLKLHGEQDGLFDRMHYWAPVAGRTVEVDFLLSRGREFVAIESKYAEEVQNSHLRGLRAIALLSGVKRRILVHRGRRPLRTEDGIEVLPVDDFLDLIRDKKL